MRGLNQFAANEPAVRPTGSNPVVSDMKSTHATVNAIKALIGLPFEFNFNSILACDFNSILACDWRMTDNGNAFIDIDARCLVRGEETFHELPSCPTCAMFIDIALSIRAENETKKNEEEMNKEKGL